VVFTCGLDSARGGRAVDQVDRAGRVEGHVDRLVEDGEPFLDLTAPVVVEDARRPRAAR
jgi:hypothetical protein